MRTSPWMLLPALALVGCLVKKSTLDKALDENASLKLQVSELQKKQADTEKTLGDKIKELQGQLGQLDETSKTREAELGKMKGHLAATDEELAELRKQRAETEKRLAAYKQLQDKFRALVDTGKLQVVFRHGQMMLKLPSGILFPSGSADLTKDGQAALGEVTKILLGFKDRRFVVAGHTDTNPIKTADFKNNWYLSTARANSVLEYMIKEKFPPKNIAAAGYGEFDPVGNNGTEQGREQNRRIEIILVPDLAELPTLTGKTP